MQPTIIALRGPYDSAKSTLGLTIPGKKAIIDLEYGSHRAAWRFPVDSYTIWTLPEKLRPAPSVDGLLNAALAEIIHVPGERLRGYREALAEIVKEYFRVLQAPDVSIIIFDTAKELWTTIHKAYLQRLHDDQLSAAKKQAPAGISDAELEAPITFRQRLQPIEYSDPNSQMNKVVYLARQWQKTLVLINHERDVYATVYENGRSVEKPTGAKELDGFSHTMDLADWVIATSRVDIIEGRDDKGADIVVRHYKATIIKSPYGKAVAGMEFIDSTFPNIARITASIAGYKSPSNGKDAN